MTNNGQKIKIRITESAENKSPPEDLPQEGFFCCDSFAGLEELATLEEVELLVFRCFIV
jgi:hypothetical protein